MGNEISTISGGITTASAAVLAGATLGQVQSLNDAVRASASHTAECAKRTIVRHVGEAAVMATATATVGLASAVTFGQIQSVNNATKSCASYTAQASTRAGSELISVADGMTDAIPVVGHVKGGFCYAIGANERGERALKSASRSIGVATGGISGMIVGGPPGAIAGGIAGGAAMDVIITGADSAINGEYRPSGLINNVGQIATAATGAERAEAIAGAISRIMVDSIAGVTTGGAVDGMSGGDVAPNADGVGGSDFAPALDIEVDPVQPEADPEPETPPEAPVFAPTIPRMTMKQFAVLAGTLYDVGVQEAIQVAANMVLDTLAPLNAANQARSGEEAGSDSRSTPVDAPAPTVDEARTQALNVDVRRTNAVDALTHAFAEMTAGFRNEIMRQNLLTPTATAALTTDLGNSAIVQLNAHAVKKRLLETLMRTVSASVKRGDPWRQVVGDAMGQVGGALGQTTATTIRDVVTSNHTKKALERMRTRFMEYVTRIRVPTNAVQGDDQPNDAVVVVEQPAVPGALHELLFALILIYAVMSAFMMATRP